MALQEDISINSENKSYRHLIDRNSFLKIILKKWWLFLCVGIVTGIGGILYAQTQKVLYKSSLTFAIDDEGSSGRSGSFLSLAAQFGINVGGGKEIFSGDNILKIIKSRRMIEKVLLSSDTLNNKSYTLIEYYLEKIKNGNDNFNKKDIHFPVGKHRSEFSYQHDSLLYKTYEEFSTNYIDADRPDRKLGIYEINVTTSNEKFTKDFTDRLVAETNNFYIELRTKKAKETLSILEDRVASMKSNLNSSINNKAQAQDVNINPAFSEGQVPIQKQQMNIQVYGTAYGEMFKNLEMARLQYLNEIPLMQIIDAANYPMQKIKVGKLKTGIIWALVSSLLLVLFFWILRIINYKWTANYSVSN